jgi:hypothetical protein
MSEDKAKAGGKSAPEDNDTEDAKGPRQRSPNYPSISVSRAMDIAAKVYAEEKRFSVPLPTVCKHAGYSGTKSGHAKRTIAALKKYGVFVDVDTGLEMTPEAKKYILSPNDTELRVATLKTMALRYEIVKQTLEQYPEGLPDDEALKRHFLLERGFTDAGATEVVEVIKDIVQVAKLYGPVQNANEVEKAIEPYTDKGAGKVFVPPAHPPVKQGEFVLRWNVGPDRVVEFRASFDPSPDDWELVGDYVNLAKKAATRHAKQETKPTGESPT